MWFSRRKVTSGKYLIHKRCVCRVIEVLPTLDVWQGEWVTGPETGQLFYQGLSQTKKSDWTPLRYVGTTDIELIDPFCCKCKVFLNSAYPGGLSNRPTKGWVCPQCF